MKDEETIYEDESTTVDKTQINSDEVQNDKEGANDMADERKGKSEFRKAATGMGAGIMLGSIAAFGFSSAANAATGERGEDGDVENGGENQNPAWADNSVDIATSISDDMSFSQAFAAARAEVGPGGAFEWHGNVYGTYTAEEWENMTPEERDEYNNHFSWNQHHSTSDTTGGELTEESVEETVEEPIEETAEQADEPIEVVSAEAEDLATDAVPHSTDDVGVSVIDDTPEVEILGVVHDVESGANIGEMIVDGQEVILIDVDGGGTFDYMAADLNNDGQITQDEFVDISADNISVHQLDNSFNEDAMFASNDGETDYINDDMMA